MTPARATLIRSATCWLEPIITKTGVMTLY